VSKTFRGTLGLASLLVLIACGSRSPKDSTTIGGGGAGDGAAGTSGSAELPTELFPESNGVDPGQLPPEQTGTTPPPSTTPGGAFVVSNSQPPGAECQVGLECSSLSCQSGSCSTAACVSDGGACGSGDECCSGSCDAGACVALNLTCKTAGNACGAASECCSGMCTDGTCSLGSSFCTQQGDLCANNSECCGGTCTIAEGAKVGTCGAPPEGATNCGGGIDGSLCNGCGQCCSRLCAPFGDTGVFICQPASGCRVNGDLCRQDTDCCGAAGSGLPGDGNVTCQKEPGADVGICRNPLSCNPHGNVCHYQDYACSISSSRNNCCGATGNSGACQLDPLGVPRCNGLSECRAVGDTCASASDCCDGKRCVADAAGQLRCAASDDPTGCIPSGGSCTVNGDCCAGVVCTALPGSTQGVCGSSSSEPPPGGAGGSGAGGAGGGGAGGAGGETPPDSETPPSYSCALFGQACSESSDCCSNIPCTNGACVYPIVIR
jgi:hypothetical protein